ncbi:hypothetical protein VTJ04DRAFT_1658 [Mycothermus thermophilus]|uniref:uncharacterized protein n=1 Tax=Humicola insolens TaxID=85995 RepID=UPI003743E950
MATPSNDNKDTKSTYGYLFTKATPFPAPTPVLDALLRAIADYISQNVGDTGEPYLTPSKLAAFYKGGGYDWDSFFVEMPHPAISTIYQGLGCQHLLLPSGDDFAPPTIPALTTKGFVRWQTIQTLLEPAVQVPVLQHTVANAALKDPDTGVPFPIDLPKESFPSQPDDDTNRWYEEMAERARRKADEEAAAEASKERSKTESSQRKPDYSHVHVRTASPPRGFFDSQMPHFAYFHIPSPRARPKAHDREHSFARDRERDNLYGRSARTTSSEESIRGRRGYSDFPPPRPHIVPEPGHRSRRAHSHSGHYSSDSESDTPHSSSRGGRRRGHRSNEPTPISVRRVYSTTSPEDSPRIIRTAAPPSRGHSPRPSTAGRMASSSSNHDESKRRSGLFEKISAFINTGPASPRNPGTRSNSSSRGRRPGGLGSGSGRGSREDVLPSSRLSQSWSDIDDYVDSEEERRRKRSRDPPPKDRDRERDRERERDRSPRTRDRRDPDPFLNHRPHLRERGRAHSDGERRGGSERDRPRDLGTRHRDGTTTAVPSPPASAASATLHRERDRDRDTTANINTTTNPTTPRHPRRGTSDESLSSPRSHYDRERERGGGSGSGSYLSSGTTTTTGTGTATTGSEGLGYRRTASHADLDREREREKGRRERERYLTTTREERVSRERGEKERDRGRERMPSPAVGVTGVGGRKYPDVVWSRE